MGAVNFPICRATLQAVCLHIINILYVLYLYISDVELDFQQILCMCIHTRTHKTQTCKYIDVDTMHLII